MPVPRMGETPMPLILSLREPVGDPSEESFLPADQLITGTGGQIEMLRAADLAGLKLAELRALNPGQLRWATAPEPGPDPRPPTTCA